ncbi:MAG: caspase family protein, partial [Bacteroidales bacterium]|nr:caspase family protein [Bacteroidales bacterium]
PQKPYWIYGAIGYSLLGTSVGMYYSSSNNYNNYLDAKTISDKNSFYDKAKLNKNLSYAFLGAAGVIWAIDYFGLIKRKREIEKAWKKNVPIKESPNIPSFKIVSALSDKEFVNTKLTTLQVVENSASYFDKDEDYCLDAFEKGYIQFKIRNLGPARADNFYAKLVTSDPNKKLTFPDSVKIGEIGVNQEKIVRVPIIAGKEIASGNVNVNVNIQAPFNNPVKPFGLLVNTCSFAYKEKVPMNEFNSDIDRDIPVLAKQGNEKFALIIGNEGYANEKTLLSKNFNVPYARHDAITFKKYVKNILGVKEDHIILLLDATKKEMYESILMLSDQVGKVKEQAELIFYYAGHGLADTNTLAPYLMPVDISPDKLTEGISVEFLYKNIWESRSVKSMVVMDASFNNGGRNIGLRGPSAKKINPRSEVLSGNTVVFNAVSERYTANTLDDMQHGLFTYYFLKELKESKGNIDYLTLSNSVKSKVSEKAILSGKEQVPLTIVSVAVRDIWQDWSVR